MTRAKVTSSDINARLARGECANFTHNSCLGRTPCTIINGEPCDYFATYVKPLLEHPDCSAKYAREAKVTVALNPNSKVVRKRRSAGDPALALDTSQAATPVKKAASQPPPATKPKATRATPRRTAPAAAPTLPVVAESRPKPARTAAAPPLKPAHTMKPAAITAKPPAPVQQPAAITTKPPAPIQQPATTSPVAAQKRQADPPQLLLELVPDAAPPKRRKTRR